jgi:hypothetical protein
MRVNKIGLILYAMLSMNMFASSTTNFRDYKNPFFRDVSSFPIPEFNESEKIPELILSDDNSTESTPTDESSDNNTTTEQADDVDFNHTNTNHKKILSTEPKFTESENIPTNQELDKQPTLDLNESNDDYAQETNNDYKDPTSKNPIDVKNPEFTEDEIVPTRDTSEVVPNIPNSVDTNDWVGVTDLGYNWRSVEWFGAYYEPPDTNSGQGWIYHVNLGWVYLSSTNFNSVWIWSSNFESWYWTNSNTFTYLFNNETGTWVFYDETSDVFYDFLQKGWLKNKR